MLNFPKSSCEKKWPKKVLGTGEIDLDKSKLMPMAVDSGMFEQISKETKDIFLQQSSVAFN